MRAFSGSLAEMFFRRHPAGRLSPEEALAERLLAGRGAGPGAPPGQQALERVLAAAARPATRRHRPAPRHWQSARWAGHVQSRHHGQPPGNDPGRHREHRADCGRRQRPRPGAHACADGNYAHDEDQRRPGERQRPGERSGERQGVRPGRTADPGPAPHADPSDRIGSARKVRRARLAAAYARSAARWVTQASAGLVPPAAAPQDRPSRSPAQLSARRGSARAPPRR